MTEIDELLRFDSLAAAEALTGQSYKDDEPTMALGMLLHMDANQRKRELLSARDDTHFGISLTDAQRIYSDLGFDVIHEHQFEGTSAPETFRVLWHSDGILAVIESYSGGDGKQGSVNTTKIYFCHRSHEGNETALWNLPMSGRSPVEGVTTGDIDTREGLRNTLTKLRELGEFVTPWIEPGYMALVDYTQWHSDGDMMTRSKDITAEVVASFPIEVQEAIGRA